MEDKKKVPRLRFPGFTGDWEQRKVGNICSISTGKSNTQDKVDDGIYPFYVRSPIVEHSNKYLYDEEAVLTVGDGVGTGKVFHYVNGKYDLHQRVYRMFGFSEDVSAKFFYDWFSEHFYKRVMAMTAKTSVDSVRYEMIADMDIQLPSLPEQKAIADFFFSLDNLITLHQRKLDNLKKLKKGCLQKMFPRNGEAKPELRFPGFTDDWEQRKLGDIASITTGKLDANAAREDGQYAFFTCGKEILKTDSYAFVGDAILINGNGDLGFTRKFSGRFNAYQRTYVLQGFEENYEFVECAIHRYLPERIKEESLGGAMPYIKLDTLSGLKLFMPKMGSSETTLVTNFFIRLDNFINLHQHEIDELKQIKKGMLQQMFV